MPSEADNLVVEDQFRLLNVLLKVGNHERVSLEVRRQVAKNRVLHNLLASSAQDFALWKTHVHLELRASVDEANLSATALQIQVTNLGSEVLQSTSVRGLGHRLKGHYLPTQKLLAKLFRAGEVKEFLFCD